MRIAEVVVAYAFQTCRHGGSVPETHDQEIVSIANEIRDYLSSHPNAADGLEGIAKWWLSRQRYQEGLAKVQKALDYLVAKGAIRKSVTGSGRTAYTSTVEDTE